MFVIRILALLLGGLALLYTTITHAYHFGPGLSSPVDLHVDLEHAYEERMEKEEPELKRAHERETRSYDCNDYAHSNDAGSCGDHGRDYR